MSANNDLDVADPETVSQVAAVFGLLIRGHSDLIRRAVVKTAHPLAERFGRLLTVFGEAYEKTDAEDRARAGGDVQRFEQLLARFAEAREQRRRQQEQSADEFNLLGVLRLTGNEVRHSMVLAWLLDHDLDRLGTHAQGPLGFRLFLEEFGLPLCYADCRYWVRREVGGDESIVDIEVAARGLFLIHIENKIWSSEGSDQTDREWADLQRRAVSVGINPDLSDAPIHALFLTPTGAKPANYHFTPVSWRRVVRVLENFAEQAKPIDVKLFASHYARAISRFIVSQAAGHGEDDVETNAE